MAHIKEIYFLEDVKYTEAQFARAHRYAFDTPTAFNLSAQTVTIGTFGALVGGYFTIFVGSEEFTLSPPSSGERKYYFQVKLENIGTTYDLTLEQNNTELTSTETIFYKTIGIATINSAQNVSLAIYDKSPMDNYLKLAGGKMRGLLEALALTSTSFTNSGVTNLNSTVNIGGTTNAQNINCGNVEATRLDSNGGAILAGGGNYDGQGGKVYAESLGLQTASGSALMSVLRYKDTTSFDVLKDMFTNSIYASGIIDLNSANFGGFVQTNQVTAWAQSAEYLRVLHPNGNSQFKLGKDTTNPTFAQTKGYLNWYDSGGVLNISLRPGASTSHGVVHESRDGAFKLAYVNTSLNSALLASNQMLIQNIESQQEMAFSTPTIDFEQINTLELQKQNLIEQNQIIEKEIIEIEQEIEEINSERVIVDE